MTKPHRKTLAATSAPSSSSAPLWDGILPSDLVFEIFSFLPVKSVLRFKCASPDLLTLTSSEKFVSEHEMRSPCSLLIHARMSPQGHALYTKQVPCRLNSILCSPIPHHLEILTFPNGIVLLIQDGNCTQLSLWNPSTRSSLRLPEPSLRIGRNEKASIGLYFKFSYGEQDYTVIRLVSGSGPEPDRAEVLSVLSRKWRVVPNRLKMVTGKYNVDSVVALGISYWISLEIYGPGSEMLTWFDATRNRFRQEKLPWETNDNYKLFFAVMLDFVSVLRWNQQTPDLELHTKAYETHKGWRKDNYNLTAISGAGGGFVGFSGWGRVLLGVDNEHELQILNLKNLSIKRLKMKDGIPSTAKVMTWRSTLVDMPAARGRNEVLVGREEIRGANEMAAGVRVIQISNEVIDSGREIRRERLTREGIQGADEMTAAGVRGIRIRDQGIDRGQEIRRVRLTEIPVGQEEIHGANEMSTAGVRGIRIRDQDETTARKKKKAE